jgi:hypothetical protein
MLIAVHSFVVYFAMIVQHLVKHQVVARFTLNAKDED